MKTPEQLFEQNKGLVHHIAYRYKCPKEHMEDMIQVGMLALWKACLGYDSDNHSARFTSYAGKAIEREYENFLGQAWNNSGLSVASCTRRVAYNAITGRSNDKIQPGYYSLFDNALSTEYITGYHGEDDAATFGDMIETYDDYSEYDDAEMNEILHNALDKLSQDDRKLLAMRFGLYGNEPMMLRQIADEMGCCPDTIRKRINLIKERLSMMLPASLKYYLEDQT